MSEPLTPADQERFTRHWTQASRMVADYIGSLVPNFHEAEDLLQNVAVVLLRKFPQYDPAQPFAFWAMGIARYEILGRRRAFARSRTVFTPDLAEQAAEIVQELDAESEARQRALRECLRGVGTKAGDVLRLRYQEALEPQDIAGRLGVSAVSIRVMLSRLRSTLQGCIQSRLAVSDQRP